MIRGLAKRIEVAGICVTNREADLPPGVELMIGEHPEPGLASIRAGQKALELSSTATLALISGGGSSLCELPVPGLTSEFVTQVSRELLRSGLPIDTINLARSHISQLKGGGLGPIETLVVSDVGGAGPDVVSSGPTAWMRRDPDVAISILKSLDIDLTPDHQSAIRSWVGPEPFETRITVVDDGRTAATGTMEAVLDQGGTAVVSESWIRGEVEEELIRFLATSGPNVTIACGEPTLKVSGHGSGGRNTQAALLAARQLAGTDSMFAAIATDGSDGSSGTAGAIVDGTTIARGGDPSRALAEYNSAAYLADVGDTVKTWDTGTNVADLWLLWNPQSSSEPILSV